MGDLTGYKGYEWIDDAYPDISLSVLEEREGIGAAPTAIDFRIKSPSCYPPASNDKEVIRDQGTCGSCWAFASASAAMHNLCMSTKLAPPASIVKQKTASAQALFNSSDRYEVSVQ